MAYIPNAERYTQMEYRRCGRSGLKLPLLSMGLWHNFGDTNSLEHMAQLCETAFDGGITHFDLANNYGPPAGAAERNFGKLLKTTWGFPVPFTSRTHSPVSPTRCWQRK